MSCWPRDPMPGCILVSTCQLLLRRLREGIQGPELLGKAKLGSRCLDTHSALSSTAFDPAVTGQWVLKQGLRKEVAGAAKRGHGSRAHLTLWSQGHSDAHGYFFTGHCTSPEHISDPAKRGSHSNGSCQRELAELREL